MSGLLEDSERAQHDDQQRRARDGDQEAHDAAAGRETERAGDPESDRRSRHSDQHVGDQAHLGIGLHQDAGEPADDSADDQTGNQSHSRIPLRFTDRRLEVRAALPLT